MATDQHTDATFRALRAPQHDATALDAVLGDPAVGAFTTRVLLNRPAQEIREEVNGLFADACPDDVLLLYLSGHGVKDAAGRLHFVATDTRNDRLASTAVSAHFVRDLIDHSLAGRVLVWLDCCYGGAFPGGLTPRAGDVDVVAQLNDRSGHGCAVMTASTHIQYAYEPGGAAETDQSRPSVFTAAIVEGLRTGAADLDGDGEITARELYEHVYERVRRATPEQTPTSSDSLSGRIVVAYAGSRPRLPAELPDEIRRLLRSPDPAFRQAGVQVLEVKAQAGDAVARHTLTLLGERTTAPAPPRVEAPRPATPWGHTAVLADDGLMAFSPDGRLLVVGRHVWDTTCWRLLRSIRAGGARAFTPDGSRLAAVSRSSVIALWDTTTWEEVDEVPCGGWRIGNMALTFSHDGTLLARTGARDELWAIERGVFRSLALPPPNLSVPPGTRSLKLSGTRPLAVAWSRDSARVFSTETGEVLCAVGHRGTEAVELSPDGTLLAFTDAGHMTVVLVIEKRPLHTVVQTSPAFSFSPDSRTLAVATAGSLRLGDALTGRLIRHLECDTSFHSRPLFSPDGRFLAVRLAQGGIRLWAHRAEDLEPLRTGWAEPVVTRSPDS